jgi:hypothetical protein
MCKNINTCCIPSRQEYQRTYRDKLQLGRTRTESPEEGSLAANIMVSSIGRDDSKVVLTIERNLARNPNIWRWIMTGMAPILGKGQGTLVSNPCHGGGGGREERTRTALELCSGLKKGAAQLHDVMIHSFVGTTWMWTVSRRKLWWVCRSLAR